MSALDSIGVALSFPGLIDVIVRAADLLYQKIEHLRDVDDAVARCRETVVDLHEGFLYLSLNALSRVSKDRLVPSKLRDQLDSALTSVKEGLTSTQEALSRVNKDTFQGRLVYALGRGEGSHHKLTKLSSALQASSDKLKYLCLQLDGFQTAVSSYLWTSDNFKIRHETSENRPGEFLPNSDIVVNTGSYNYQGQRFEGDFILENKPRENDVRYICSKLSTDVLAGKDGILPVLGYRLPLYNEPDGSKAFQLIVELPRNLDRASLTHLICSTNIPDIGDRLRLCHGLVRALSSVHSLALVHKRIRSRAILVLSAPAARMSDCQIFLQDWTYIRDVSDATTQLGEEAWQRALYQHPKRQGKYAEAVYQPQHDIYGLGVCMLEILLWTPFVVATADETSVCDLFESVGLKLGEQNGGLPERYKGAPSRLLSRPRATQAVWQQIARSEIVDDRIAHLVLRCLDGKFPSISEVASELKLIMVRQGLSLEA